MNFTPQWCYKTSLFFKNSLCGSTHVYPIGWNKTPYYDTNFALTFEESKKLPKVFFIKWYGTNDVKRDILHRFYIVLNLRFYLVLLTPFWRPCWLCHQTSSIWASWFQPPLPRSRLRKRNKQKVVSNQNMNTRRNRACVWCVCKLLSV